MYTLYSHTHLGRGCGKLGGQQQPAGSLSGGGIDVTADPSRASVRTLSVIRHVQVCERQLNGYFSMLFIKGWEWDFQCSGKG